MRSFELHGVTSMIDTTCWNDYDRVIDTTCWNDSDRGNSQLLVVVGFYRLDLRVDIAPPQPATLGEDG